MKTEIVVKKSIIFAVVFLTASVCLAQFFPTGGYQEGLYGNGGDETFQIFLPEPRGLIAIGGDDEVYLEWDIPFPIGEIKYDDGTAEMWYWLSNPTSSNDMFYVRFNSPVKGYISDIAVLNGAYGNVAWDQILICPDNGSGEPDLSAAWETFSSVAVNSFPDVGGEWSILSLSTSQPVIANEVFYIVTRWPDGSTIGPFLATDVDSDAGRSAWSMDGGGTWGSWPENFIMRAYITDTDSKSMTLVQEKNQKTGHLPVVSIVTGKSQGLDVDKIAQYVKVPNLTTSKSYSFKSLNNYNIYRSDISGGSYVYIDNTTNLEYTDLTVSNDQLYYYVVTAQYDEGESDNSNETSAFPQAVVNVPFSNNFDIDDGDFYGTGDWQWGAPGYVSGPISANSPPNVWGTILSGDYSNNSYSWLVLPFNLSGSAVNTLSFANWFSLESGIDYGYLAIDPENDGTFDILDSYTGSSGGWTQEELVIDPSYSSPYCKIAFVLQSDNSIVDAGFYIDDLDLKRHIELDLNVYLEGPFNGTDMDVGINSILPLDQPYDVLPWNYSGAESVVTIPNPDIVDWILVELRDAPDAVSAIPSTMIAQQAAFLAKDGSIVGLDGLSNLQFNNSINQNLFIVLRHRNHLGVMSADPLVGVSGYYTYDFRLSDLSVYGGSLGYVQLDPGIWGMVSGDADANNVIDMNDKSIDWSMNAGEQGYLPTDFNMDGQTDNPDKNDAWLDNITKESQIPE